MKDHPIIIPTAKGPVGGIVSEPERPAQGALILFQGGGPPARCGVNAIWTRTAHQLAGAGLVVLRFDFACEADSAMVGTEASRGPAWRSSVDLPVTREVSSWFRERVGMDVLVAGSCYGARLALELAAEDPGVGGVFLVAPYLAGVRRKRPPAAADDQVAKARAELPNPPEDQHDRLSAVAVDSSKAILARGCPLWILIGEHDPPHALELESRLDESTAGAIEVEVAAGAELHPGTDPAAQELIAGRIVERVSRTLPAAGPAR